MTNSGRRGETDPDFEISCAARCAIFIGAIPCENAAFIALSLITTTHPAAIGVPNPKVCHVENRTDIHYG
ncbi:MAG: hypothetical protein BroJett018_24300 [Chloroflexota bacterium]|nr:MAG: hypothetical protein BroJett018_24300 [Chloroflexota bacterium]